MILRKSPERQVWKCTAWKRHGRSTEAVFVFLIPPMPEGMGLRNFVRNSIALISPKQSNLQDCQIFGQSLGFAGFQLLQFFKHFKTASFSSSLFQKTDSRKYLVKLHATNSTSWLLPHSLQCCSSRLFAVCKSLAWTDHYAFS